MIRFTHFLVLIFLCRGEYFSFRPPLPVLQLAESPFRYCDGFEPVGGGYSYDRIVKRAQKTVLPGNMTPVELGNHLRRIIYEAKPRQTVYIDANCTIEVSESIEINKPLTIAGNRGVDGSKGALIRSTKNDNFVFKVNVKDVRITGLRFEGNQSVEVIDHAVQVMDKDSTKMAITTFELDNCEFYDWAIAVEVSHYLMKTHRGYSIEIHNNFFHDNVCPGYGYGVDVGNAFVRVYGNLFENNRHDIACSGTPLSGYEAFCNVINEGSSEVSNFDVHGGAANRADYAGRFFKIHHNDFRDLNCQGNIFVVGRPRVACVITNNRFFTDNIYRPLTECPREHVAVQNRPSGENLNELSPEAFGNVIAVNNIYAGVYKGWYVRERWNRNRLDNLFRIPSENDLLLSLLNAELIESGDVNPVAQDLDYYFGDMDGDGNTDIFRADGKRWSYLPLGSGYNGEWILIREATEPVGKIMFDTRTSSYDCVASLYVQNFGGNNNADIAVGEPANSDVKIFLDGKKLQTPIGITKQFLVGRFSKKRGDDTFSFLTQTQGGYFIHQHARWRLFRNEMVSRGKVLFTGDFNGDGWSDILLNDEGVWKYSDSRNISWTPIKKLNDATKFIIGNLNAREGPKSDIVGFVEGHWKILIDGSGEWHMPDTSLVPLQDLPYGDMR
jgi:hypothetical protein